MATGTFADFKIIDDQFFGGLVEKSTQNVDAFNASSNGALVLQPAAHTGRSQEESFVTYSGNNVSRRDPSSTASVTPNKLTMDDFVRVKLDRKIGPLSQTRDAFVKMGMSPEMLSSWFGEQVGPDVQKDYLNSAIRALVACLTKQSSTTNDQSGTGTITTSMLNGTMRLLGDRSERVIAWVMHSKVAHDLFDDQVANYVGGIGQFLIIQGNTATLGKPVIVTDSPVLENTTPTPTEYRTLALVNSAAGVFESEDRFVYSELKGTEEESFRQVVKGEYAITVGVKGFAYDVATGGDNPNDSALVNSANWLLKANDIKDGPGAVLITQ